MPVKIFGLLALGCSLAVSSSAMADDWIAASVSGVVMTVKNGQWAHLRPGDVLSDRQQVRSLASGDATFEREGETVSIAGNTQISISEERGGHYTRVTQAFGTTTVADNEQARPHFEVDTPYMAAVVKGTVFTVWSRPGLSGVNVKRGRVEVQDHNSHLHVDVLAGQQASGGTSQPLRVAGLGSLQPIKNQAGQIVAEATQGTTEVAPLPGAAISSGKVSAGTDNGDSKPAPGAPKGPAGSSTPGGSAAPSGQTAPGGPGGPSGAGGPSGPGGPGSPGGPGKTDNGVGNGGTPGDGGQNGNGNGNNGGKGNGDDGGNGKGHGHGG